MYHFRFFIYYSLCQEGESHLVIRLPGKWRILLWRISFPGKVGVNFVQRQWPSDVGFAENPFIIANAKAGGDPNSYAMYTGGNASFFECYVLTNNANECTANVLAVGKGA